MQQWKDGCIEIYNSPALYYRKNLNIMTLKTFGNPAKITVAIFKKQKMAQIQINLSCVEKKV